MLQIGSPRTFHSALIQGCIVISYNIMNIKEKLRKIKDKEAQYYSVSL